MNPLTTTREYVLGALLAAAVSLNLRAQTWVTADAYQLPGTEWCRALNLAADSSGRVFVAGRGFASGASNGSLAVRRSNDRGVSWETVFTLDQFQASFRTFKVFTGAAGAVFLTVGTGSDAWQGGADAMRWIAYRSDNGGDTWTVLDDFGLTPGYPSVPTAAAADQLGNVYVAGYAFSDSPVGQWKPIMRRSADGGQTWTTLDLPGYTGPQALAATPRGLFAVGGDSYRWTVWRSVDHGTNWSTVDTFSLGPEGMSSARGVTADAAGNVFVVGDASPDFHPHWIVRRSTDGGSNWTTVDSLVPAGGDASAAAVEVGPTGRIWVVGYDQNHWRVRSSDDVGTTWTDSDVFAPGRFSEAYSVGTDSDGNAFVAGYGSTPAPEVWTESWTVRKLAAPPRLVIDVLGGQVQIAWPANQAGFVLQSATTLANGGDWQDSNLTPVESNGQNVIAVDATNAAGFFRLRQP